MRHAFAAIEIFRMKKHLGADDPRTVAARNTALEQKNPYTDVDFAIVADKMPRGFFGQSDIPVLDVIDAVAKPAPAKPTGMKP